MSTLYVDEIAGIASADTVAIPGHVIQVVQHRTTSEEETSSSSYVDTDLQIDITPSSVNSKILVLIDASVTSADTNASGQRRGDLALYYLGEGGLTANDLLAAKNFGLYGSSSISGNEWQIYGSTVISYLHSPNTTNSVRYDTKIRATGGVNFRLNTEGSSTITAMEIAG